jgi:hypothetical protein
MKRVILLFLALTITVTGIGIAYWYFQNKPVAFTLEQSGYRVEIYGEKENRLSTLTSSDTVRLTEGSYSYKIIGDNYDPEAVAFDVKGSTTNITVTPKRSQAYLDSQLSSERSVITASLQQAFPSISYTFTTLKLYEQGQWAAGTLQLVGNPRQLPDTYRFILEKVGSNWTVRVSPRIVITVSDFPNIPKSIIFDLYSANSL